MRPSARPVPPAANRARAHSMRPHVVAVHGVADLIGRDEEVAVDIRARRVRHDEAITVAMRDQAADYEIGIVRWRFRLRFHAGCREVLLARCRTSSGVTHDEAIPPAAQFFHEFAVF